MLNNNDNQYTTIQVQNQSLQKYLSGMDDYYSLERNQFARKSERLPILGYIIFGLIILYVIVYIVFLLVLFIKAKKLSLKFKFLLVTIFALYPFFIYSVENALYQIYYYVYAVMYGESYHTIMQRKGVQNPKNFKDVGNLMYYFNNLGSITRNYALELKNRMNNLPEQLKSKFLELQDIIKTIPDKSKQNLLDLHNEILTLYEEAKNKISNLKNIEEMKSSLEKFKNDIQTKIKNFWEQIKNTLTDNVKKSLENIINNLQLQLNIQIYLQQLPEILTSLFTELQQKMSSIPNDVNNYLLVLYQDMITSYQDFKTKITNVTDINQIKSSITNFENTINNKLNIFTDSLKNIDLSNDIKTDIKNNITNFIMQLNIQVGLDKQQSIVINNPNDIVQKEKELHITLQESFDNQYNELSQKEKQNKYFSDKEIDDIIVKYTNIISNKINDFLTYVNQSNEPNNKKTIIKINCLQNFSIIVSYSVVNYLYYFIYQIKKYPPKNITINDDIKQMLDIYKNDMNSVIYTYQNSIYLADTKEKIDKLNSDVVYKLLYIYVKLILNINKLSVSDDIKNFLRTQSTEKANMISVYVLNQQYKYNTLSSIIY